MDKRAFLESRMANISPEKRKLLEQRLKGISKGTAQTITIIERKPENIPLSAVQNGFWFMDAMDPGNPMFNQPTAMRLFGPLKPHILKKSIDLLILRHESLRTIFPQFDDLPVQKILPVLGIPVTVIDLHTIPNELQEKEIQRIISKESKRPFNLQKGPLLRLVLVRTNDLETCALMTFHHIICDGWSLEIFMNELEKTFEAISYGRKPAFNELSYQYSDFSLWHEKFLTREKIDDQLLYWDRQLANAPHHLEFPTDFPRRMFSGFSGGICSSVIGQVLSERTRQLTHSAGCTPFMVYLSVLAILLSRYSGQEDIIIGTPVFNRIRKEFESIIGLFINTLALRFNLSGNPTFIEFLKRVEKMVLDAFSHQDVPFYEVVRKVCSDSSRDSSFSPLFQILFAYQSYSKERKKTCGDVSAKGMQSNESKATYDISFEIRTREDGVLIVSSEYKTELFNRSTQLRLLNHYKNMLEQIVERPNHPIGLIEVMTKEEKYHILEDLNKTDCDFPEKYCFHEIFEEQVESYPSATAVVSGKNKLSYFELNSMANILANHLLRNRIESEDIVAIVMERSHLFLISMIGIFKSGAAYLPIEPGYPEKRIEKIFEIGKVKYVITHELCYEKISDVCKYMSIPCVSINTILENKEFSTDPGCEVDVKSTAYCIFTSGSTGLPKGALVEHKGMVNHLYAKIHDLQISERDRMAQTASQCFDISVWQFCVALCKGGTVVIFDDETVRDTKMLVDELIREKITIWETVPSLIRAVIEEINQAEYSPEFSSLCYLILTGEALPPDICKSWFSQYNAIPIVNAYGPTECSDDVTHHIVTSEKEIKGAFTPIGRAIINTKLYILDKYLNPVPPGVAGELYVYFSRLINQLF